MQSPTSLTVKLSGLEPPREEFCADSAGIVRKGDEVRLLLLQSRAIGLGARAMVDVTISIDGVNRLLGTCVEFMAENSAFMGAQRLPAVPLSLPLEEPSDVLGRRANIIVCARASREATLDLHHLSAAAAHAAASAGGDDIDVQPVLRVHMHIGLLMSILQGLGAVSQEIGGQP